MLASPVSGNTSIAFFRAKTSIRKPYKYFAWNIPHKYAIFLPKITATKTVAFLFFGNPGFRAIMVSRVFYTIIFGYMKSASAFLAELGLSTLEAEIYETALGLGTFPASVIANRLNIPRSTVRYTCESLVRKGLMIETKKANTKLFVAENPTKLFSMLNAEEERIVRKKEQLASTIKELREMYNPDAKIPKFAFYEGVDGMDRMLDDLLKTPIQGEPPKTLYAFGATDYLV